MNSKYTDQCDDNNIICPYCGYEYQPEPEDWSEDDSVHECGECGKNFHSHQSFTTTHHSEPDCELNGNKHVWESVKLKSGKEHDFCKICDKCRPIKERKHE